MNKFIETFGRMIISCILLSLTLEWNISKTDWIAWGTVYIFLIIWIANSIPKRFINFQEKKK